jgi:hypothetical protein
MYMEEVSLPAPPEGYEYILRKKAPIRNKDPSELTPRQLASLKYREKNKNKLNELSRIKYHENKSQKETVPLKS